MFVIFFAFVIVPSLREADTAQTDKGIGRIATAQNSKQNETENIPRLSAPQMNFIFSKKNPQLVSKGFAADSRKTVSCHLHKFLLCLGGHISRAASFLFFSES